MIVLCVVDGVVANGKDSESRTWTTIQSNFNPSITNITSGTPNHFLSRPPRPASGTKTFHRPKLDTVQGFRH